MKAIVALLGLVCMNGCVPLLAGAITNNALERNSDRKEWAEKHRHQERMRELDLQEKLINRQYPPGSDTGTDAGIVRQDPY